MNVGGFSESIWHFLGYLHIADAVARSETLLDGVPQRTVKIDIVATVPVDDRTPDDLDDLTSRPSPLDRPADILDPALLRLSQAADHFAGFSRVAAGTSMMPSGTQPSFSGILGGFQVLDELKPISVTYEQNGEQMLASLTQVNKMLDRDVVSDGHLLVKTADGWSDSFQPIDSFEALGDAVATAQGLTPADLVVISSANTASIADFVEARDNAWSISGASHANAVEPGRYVDGVASEDQPGLADEAPEVAGIKTAVVVTDGDTITSTVTGPSDGIGTGAVTGENESTNAAFIRDVSGINGSTIVAGNAYFSNVIVQVNVLVDSDHASIMIGNGPDPLLAGFARSAAGDGNAVHNIAEFVTHEYSSVLKGAALTPSWTVDVVQGDFFCVKALTQLNVLLDDDVVTQSTFNTYYKLSTGENEQVNITDVSGFGLYDVIIIGGDSHHANWIFQKNILLDSDWVASYANPGEGGQQTIFAGGNSLTNDARISTYRPSEHQDIIDAQRDLIAALDRGETTLAPDPAWQLAGSASGTLKVLYVTGDYYDINLISQTNVVSDMDQVAQWTAAAGDISQAAVTGANTLLNAAEIVDAGTLSGSSFIGGEVYQESLLIQANIVTEQDKITVYDNAAYVPELIAFTSEGDGRTDDQTYEPTKVCDPSLYDSPGNVLT